MYQLRDIYSICRCCWNVATYKWKVHNGKIEIISFIVMFRSYPPSLSFPNTSRFCPHSWHITGFVDPFLSFCTFSFDHCVFCSIYGLWLCLLVCYNPNVVDACWCVTTRTSCMPVGMLQPERRVCLLVCYKPNVVDACWCVTTRTSTCKHFPVLSSFMTYNQVCISLFVLLYFLFDHCVVCSIYGLWLPLWYLNVVYACWYVTTRTSCMPVGVLQAERRGCLLVCYNPNVVYACWCVTTTFGL
jgi:hypothetical protein